VRTIIDEQFERIPDWVDALVRKAKMEMETRGCPARWVVVRKLPGGFFFSFYTDGEAALAEYGLELQSVFESSDSETKAERIAEARNSVSLLDVNSQFAALCMHGEERDNCGKEASQ